MITDIELQNLLIDCYQTIDNAHLHSDEIKPFFAHLSLEILQATVKRPLPDYNALKESSEALDLLKSIMLNSIQKRATLHLAMQNLTQLKSAFDVAIAEFDEKRSFLEVNEIVCELLKLHQPVFGDRIPIKQKAGISLDEFKAGLSEQSDGTLIEPFKKVFKYICLKYEEKLNEKTMCYPIYVSLAKISLKLHSEHCVADLSHNHGPAHLIHFYESASSVVECFRPGSPRASEYLDTFDSDAEMDNTFSFDKTSHGLGSGVYGLAAVDEAMINQQIDDLKSNFKIYEIQCPLRLIDTNDANESDQLTQLSKYLQRVCNELRDLRMKYKGSKYPRFQQVKREGIVNLFINDQEKQSELREQARILCGLEHIKKMDPAFTLEQMYDVLLESLREFFQHADRKSFHIVPMPINYVIKKLGFTGVVSAFNDKFNRGLIAIELDNKVLDLAFIPIKPLNLNSTSASPRTLVSPWSGGVLTPTKLSNRTRSSSDGWSRTLLSTDEHDDEIDVINSSSGKILG